MDPGVRAALHRRDIPGAGQRQVPHRPRHPEVALTQINQRHVDFSFHLQNGAAPQDGPRRSTTGYPGTAPPGLHRRPSAPPAVGPETGSREGWGQS